jgi:hypothetical protein
VCICGSGMVESQGKGLDGLEAEVNEWIVVAVVVVVSRLLYS